MTTVFVDSAFKSNPKPFYQMFIVFITVRHCFVLVVFSHLSNETAEVYQIVMDQFAPYVSNVTTVFADIKQSIHSAVSSS